MSQNIHMEKIFINVTDFKYGVLIAGGEYMVFLWFCLHLFLYEGYTSKLHQAEWCHACHKKKYILQVLQSRWINKNVGKYNKFLTKFSQDLTQKVTRRNLLYVVSLNQVSSLWTLTPQSICLIIPSVPTCQTTESEREVHFQQINFPIHTSRACCHAH